MYQINMVGPLSGQFAYPGNPFDGYNECGYRTDIVSRQEGRSPLDNAVAGVAQQDDFNYVQAAFPIPSICRSIQVCGPSGCDHFISVSINNLISLFYQATFFNKVPGKLTSTFLWTNALNGLASLLFFSA